MINKIRFWLLRMIAGKSAIAFNFEINSNTGINIDNSKHYAFSYNMKVAGFNEAVSR